MANQEEKRELTEMEKKFLHFLKTDAKGDIKTALQMAGYTDATIRGSTSEIKKRLKHEIHEATLEMLAEKGPRAVAALTDLLDEPNKLGAGNLIKAVAQVLDRLGVAKTSEPQSKGPQGGIFILPPKDGTIVIKSTNDDEEE